MRSLSSVLLWLYYGFCFFVFWILVSIIYLLTFPFDRHRRIPNWLLRGLAASMMKAVPGWKIDIYGTGNYKGDRPVVFVANHQSFLDMPLLYLLPWTMKWISKKSLFLIPGLGWIMFMTGQIGIDRTARSSPGQFDRLTEPVRAGIPLMIFPEGTRTPDGKVKRFKNGAFLMARRYNFQMIPIVLNGGYEALPSGAWKFRFNRRFVISILEPVDPGSFDSVENFKNHVHQTITNELARIRRQEAEAEHGIPKGS